MKRILVAVGAIWGLVAVGAVALLLWRDRFGPPPPPPPPLSCATLQDRVSACRDALSRDAGELVEQISRQGGASPATAAGRRFVAEGLLRGAIDAKQVRAYCVSWRTARIPRVRRLWGEIARCWPARGCRAFSACLRRVAEAEQAAGRLPLF